MPLPDSSDICFLTDSKTEDQLVKCYKTHSLLNDRNQGDMIGESLTAEAKSSLTFQVKNALEKLEKLAPEYFSLLELAIHTFFFRHSSKATGGSTSSALGVIWVSNQANLSEKDLIELLIHELTHHLFFIDELCHLHYSDYDSISQPNNYAKSAILKIKRPLDKVMHSIIVGAELILARNAFLFKLDSPSTIHPPTEKLVEDVLESIQSVYMVPALKKLLRKRGQEVLERTQEALKSYEKCLN